MGFGSLLDHFFPCSFLETLGYFPSSEEVLVKNLLVSWRCYEGQSVMTLFVPHHGQDFVV
jgi:hypothetical protein